MTPRASWEPSPHGGLGRPNFRSGGVVCSRSSGYGLGLTVHSGLGSQQVATGLHLTWCRPGALMTSCHPALSRRKFSRPRVPMIKWQCTVGQNLNLCFTVQLQRNKVRGPRRHCRWPGVWAALLGSPVLIWGLFSGAAHPGAHENWRAQEGTCLVVAGPSWLCPTLGSEVGGGRGFHSHIPGPGVRPP